MKVNKTKAEQTTSAELLKDEPEAQVVSLSAETVEAIAEAVAEKFAQVAVPLMILHARFCAADTVRTCERPDTVFRHAINEAKIAKAEFNKHFQAIDD